MRSLCHPVPCASAVPHSGPGHIAPFYGIALGEFTGGALCVESAPCEVTMVDTRGRLVMVDGRYRLLTLQRNLWSTGVTKLLTLQ